MKKTLTAAATVTAILLTACDGKTDMKPAAEGHPYEVFVSGGDREAVIALGGMLRAIKTRNMPQMESAFDVHELYGSQWQGRKHAGCMVMAVTDSGRYTTTSIKYEYDVYAEPQIIIYVCTPSAARLQADSARTGRALAQTVERFETKTAIGLLARKRDRDAEKTVKAMTGRSIWIPEGIGATRRGRDFVWFSDNSATAMRNICIYSYPGTDTSPETVVRMRDSVMKRNMPGETDGMFMRTERLMTPETATADKGDGRTIVRGLWVMDGDAMGGPFVSHAVADSTHGRVVVADAFVYAPGLRKRNLIRQLEAALYTFK